MVNVNYTELKKWERLYSEINIFYGWAYASRLVLSGRIKQDWSVRFFFKSIFKTRKRGEEMAYQALEKFRSVEENLQQYEAEKQANAEKVLTKAREDLLREIDDEKARLNEEYEREKEQIAQEISALRQKIITKQSAEKEKLSERLSQNKEATIQLIIKRVKEFYGN